MPGSVLNLDGVGKVFRPCTVALRDVTLAIEPGEVLGLVGHNGAGKTVLVKLAAGLTEPSSGTVRVLGLDVARQARAVRARVGLATCDERSFYWRLTGRENLRFFAGLCGMDRARAARRIAELAEPLDLRAALERPYAQLSAGNRQRLAVARALLADPPLLLLDEPTRSLDPAAAAALRALVAERCRTAGRAVLFTTHDMEEVQQLCSRVAVLHAGRLVDCADLATLRARYRIAEEVTIRTKAALPAAALAALRASLPGAALAGPSELRLERDAGDSALERALGVLVAHRVAVEACTTRTAGLRELLERIVRGNGHA